MRCKLVLALLVPILTACGAASVEDGRLLAQPSLDSLRNGDFAGARRQAEQVLHTDPSNPKAAAVRALTRYERTMHRVARDTRTLAVGLAIGGFNEPYFRTAFEQAESELAKVDEDLARVERDQNFTIDLCIACWKLDWNADGRYDERDERLPEIELDAQGKPIPENDPRRRPTFHFDHGDVHWARAFVAFQRAVLDLALAYDWQNLETLVREPRNRPPEKVRIALTHPERIHAARELILTGLHESDEARKDYLAERDDDREWLPNPRQKSHALPLPVDAALYETWQAVIADLERLVRGKEGVRLADLARLEDPNGRSPQGYLDISRLFSDPHDLVIDPRSLEKSEREQDPEALAKSLFGSAYVRQIRRSRLPDRLRRMQGEIDRGEEPLERKLRYLFWIN